jgi:hypothetical protein
MIKELIKLANYLDERGLRKEADYLDLVIKKYADPFDDAFGDMDDSLADTAAQPNALYPENEAAIPGVIKAMNAEVGALDPGLSDQDRAFKELSITGKYGLIRQDNTYYYFNSKDGGQVKSLK